MPFVLPPAVVGANIDVRLSPDGLIAVTTYVDSAAVKAYLYRVGLSGPRRGRKELVSGPFNPYSPPAYIECTNAGVISYLRSSPTTGNTRPCFSGDIDVFNNLGISAIPTPLGSITYPDTVYSGVGPYVGVQGLRLSIDGDKIECSTVYTIDGVAFAYGAAEIWVSGASISDTTTAGTTTQFIANLAQPAPKFNYVSDPDYFGYDTVATGGTFDYTVATDGETVVLWDPYGYGGGEFNAFYVLSTHQQGYFWNHASGQTMELPI